MRHELGLHTHGIILPTAKLHGTIYGSLQNRPNFCTSESCCVGSSPALLACVRKEFSPLSPSCGRLSRSPELSCGSGQHHPGKQRATYPLGAVVPFQCRIVVILLLLVTNWLPLVVVVVDKEALRPHRDRRRRPLGRSEVESRRLDGMSRRQRGRWRRRRHRASPGGFFFWCSRLLGRFPPRESLGRRSALSSRRCLKLLPRCCLGAVCALCPLRLLRRVARPFANGHQQELAVDSIARICQHHRSCRCRVLGCEIVSRDSGMLDDGAEVPDIHDDVEVVLDLKVVEFVNIDGDGCMERLLEDLCS